MSPILVTDEVLAANHHQNCNKVLFHRELVGSLNERVEKTTTRFI